MAHRTISFEFICCLFINISSFFFFNVSLFNWEGFESVCVLRLMLLKCSMQKKKGVELKQENPGSSLIVYTDVSPWQALIELRSACHATKNT